MILEVQHETRLQYSDPITEWVAEVRMAPSSDERQTCQSFNLRLSEPAAVFDYFDGFGNQVHHVNLPTPHAEVRMLAASVVETHSPAVALSASSARYPLPEDTVIVRVPPPPPPTMKRSPNPQLRSVAQVLPAPPIRYSFLFSETTGTGASGEMRSTFPHM